MKLRLIITVAVVFMGLTACKRGTADPSTIEAEQTTSSTLPSDVTFAADSANVNATATNLNSDSAATTVIPEAVAKEQLAAQQEQVATKTNVPPATGAAKKKSATKQKNPAPVKLNAVQEKWCDIVGERGSLSVGNAVARMTDDASKARGIYALYAISRYLALGNQDAAEIEWTKFQEERNGPHAALLNSLFAASKNCDHGFSTFAAGKAVKKKKKKG